MDKRRYKRRNRIEIMFAQTGGQLLCHLISALYGQTSIMITTNLAFDE